jgi:DNA-binding transcriptional LysR family regulator
LTSAGAAFLRDARNLVSASRAAELTARRAGDGLTGELRIGAVTSAFNDPLPQLIAQHGQRYPDVDLLLEEVDTHEAADALLGHRLDIVIARLTNTPAGLRHATLRRDHFVLLMPTSWTQSSRAPIGVGQYRAGDVAHPHLSVRPAACGCRRPRRVRA